MLRVELKDAHPGMTLALPVANPQAPDHNLLNLGYELTPPVIARLEEFNVRSIWVRYPGMEFLDRFIDPAVIDSQSKVVNRITDAFEQVQQDASPRLSYNQYTAAISQLVTSFIENPKAAVFMDALTEGGDSDLVRHSSAVMLLSVLMGLKLEGYLVRERKHIDPARAKQVVNLGVGAMLHDIGLAKLPPEVVQHERESHAASDAYREHTAIGYRMVRGQIEPSAAAVLLQHHQRYDGTGYTGSDFPVLEGGRIHIFPRIVALADALDRLKHPHGFDEQPTVWCLHALLQDSIQAQFDPEVMRALFAVVPPYPPGSLVHLTDGRSAIATDHHLTDPCHPNVQIIPDCARREDLPPAGLPIGETIDLSDPESELDIARCEGVEVHHLNFDPPEFMQADRLFHLYA